MKARIISRVDDRFRRDFQLAQMQRIGLDFEFVDAIEAATLSDEECRQAAQTWPGRSLPQDIACFHSHRKAWEQVVETGELNLVLEDDAVLADTISEVIDSIAVRHDHWRRVYDLEFTPEPHIIANEPTWQDLNTEVSASRVYRNRVGLAGYLIGPEAAARLLAETRRYRLVDSYVWQRPWLHAQIVEPAQVVQMRFFPDAAQEPAFVRSGQSRTFRPDSKFRNFLLRMEIELARSRSLVAAAGRSTRRQPRIDWSKFSSGRSPLQRTSSPSLG